MQPLSDVEVAIQAGEVKWLLTITTLRPHARAFRNRCLRCREMARLHGVDQSRVRAVTSTRAGCGGCRRLHTCRGGAASG
eukprot:scaffold50194_cov74-Phaeocystis_antarctica.AAC.1